MTEDPHAAGRVEGKLDILIDTQNDTREYVRNLGDRLEAVEQNKANSEDVRRIADRVNAIESFKNSVKGVLIAVSTIITGLGAWLAKKFTGA